MIEQTDINTIQETVKDVLTAMTMADFRVAAGVAAPGQETGVSVKSPSESVEVGIELLEPQFLIGQHGQALAELEYLVRIIVQKKLKKPMYVKVDINGYKKKKIEHLRQLALSLAQEVAFTKKEKVLHPMSSYERMVVHSALANRSDVVTESRGDGKERFVAIKPV